MKKILAIIFSAAMAFCLLVSCGSSNTSESESSSNSNSAEEAVESAKNENVVNVSVEESDVEDLIDIKDVTIPAGSSTADFMKAIDHDTDTVNYVSYDLNDADLDTPGTYTVLASINVPVDVAEKYVDKSEIGNDADSVDLETSFTLTVTQSEETSETTEESAEEETETETEEVTEVEHPAPTESVAVEEQPEA